MFNNSALYTPRDQGTTTTKFYWKMCLESIKVFEDYVLSSNRLPLSLRQSAAVLDKRKYLQVCIESTHNKMVKNF